MTPMSKPLFHCGKCLLILHENNEQQHLRMHETQLQHVLYQQKQQHSSLAPSSYSKTFYEFFHQDQLQNQHYVHLSEILHTPTSPISSDSFEKQMDDVFMRDCDTHNDDTEMKETEDSHQQHHENQLEDELNLNKALTAEQLLELLRKPVRMLRLPTVYAYCKPCNTVSKLKQKCTVCNNRNVYVRERDTGKEYSGTNFTKSRRASSKVKEQAEQYFKTSEFDTNFDEALVFQRVATEINMLYNDLRKFSSSMAPVHQLMMEAWPLHIIKQAIDRLLMPNVNIDKRRGSRQHLQLSSATSTRAQSPQQEQRQQQKHKTAKRVKQSQSPPSGAASPSQVSIKSESATSSPSASPPSTTSAVATKVKFSNSKAFDTILCKQCGTKWHYSEKYKAYLVRNDPTQFFNFHHRTCSTCGGTGRAICKVCNKKVTPSYIKKHYELQHSMSL